MKKDHTMEFRAVNQQETAEDRSRLLSQISNPQILRNKNVVGQISHLNPLLQNHKSFIAQVKHRHVNGDMINNNSHFGVNEYENGGERGKANCFLVERTEKNQAKYDYLVSAQRQYQLLRTESHKQFPSKSSNQNKIESNLLEEIKVLKEENKSLSQQYLDLVDRCVKLEGILQEKDQFWQNFFQIKTDQYTSAMTSKSNQIKSIQSRINILEQENLSLTQKLQKLLMPSIDNAVKIDLNKFLSISVQFQMRINQLIDQNGKLKNIISQQQGKMEQLHNQSSSLQKVVRAFEERDQINKDQKLLSEIEDLREQLERQQQEQDLLMSKHEVQILKLQNEMSEKRYEVNGSLLEFSDKERLFESYLSVIDQIQRLKKLITETR